MRGPVGIVRRTPGPAWEYLADAVHPSAPKRDRTDPLKLEYLVRHRGTGVYSLWNGERLRQVPQEWASETATAAPPPDLSDAELAHAATDAASGGNVSAFARALGVDDSNVRDWRAGRTAPTTSTRLLLRWIVRDPAGFRALTSRDAPDERNV